MTYDPDDPRLTAYALGELDDPADRAAVEALLETDPEGRRAVEELRSLAGLLSESLRHETGAGLAPEQHQAIEQCLTRRPPARWAYALGGLALAASALLAVGLASRIGHHARPAGPRIELVQNAPTPRGASAPAPAPAAAAEGMNRLADLELPRAPAAVADAPAAPEPAVADDRVESLGRSRSLAGRVAEAPRFKAGLATEAARSLPPAPPVVMAAPSASSSHLSYNGAPSPAGPSPADQRAPVMTAPALAQSAAGATPAPMVAGKPGQGVAPATTYAYSPDGRQVASAAAAPSSTPVFAKPGAQGGMGGGAGLAPASDKFGSQRGVSRMMAGVELGRPQQGLPGQGEPPAQLARGFEAQQQTNAGQQPGGQRQGDDRLAKRGRIEREALGLTVATGRPAAEKRDLNQLVDAQKAPARLELKAEALVEQEAPADRGGEAFAPIVDNPFIEARVDPLSTFAVDVDTAGYANVRRYLTQGALPPRDAVKIEEMVNYFHYNYPQPADDAPFAVDCEVARCPWDGDHRLARIALQGREIAPGQRPASNLVFLVDVSGSMTDADKLPLVQEGLRLLVEQLGENDRVAIVVYAAREGLALPSANGSKSAEILSAINQLQAGGSTNGAGGIRLAYDVAKANFIQGGTNRVILATDGDFNVGIVENGELERFIAEKRESGIGLTVLGVGQGDLKNDRLELLADKGDGQYHYLDSRREAERVLVEQVAGTLTTIAKDVKIQVKFDAEQVARFRLLGYENRLMAHADFRNDRKDAGEIGAGHSVTALYEIVPAGERKADVPLMTVFLRYKAPAAKMDDPAKEISRPVVDEGKDLSRASDDTKFAAAVAGFGMLLRGTAPAGEATFAGLRELAASAVGTDPGGYRKEFLGLVDRAREISGRP